MARTNAVNFSGALQFPMASAATDLFKKEDVQTLALAVDGHDHSTGKGLILPASAIPDGSITSAKIVDGTVGTVDLAQNCVHTLLGSYFATPAFSTSTTSTWVQTPIQATGSVQAPAGYLVHVEGWLTLSHSVVNGSWFVGLYRGGAITAYVAVGTSSTVNASQQVGFSYYEQPGAGSYTWSIWVNNSVPGTLSISGSVQASLVITEIKK